MLGTVKETIKYLTGIVGESGFGSKSTVDEVLEDTNLGTITAIITGATSGIGLELALALANRSATLVLPTHHPHTADTIISRIASDFPNAQIIALPLDLSSLSSVRSFVSRFEALNLPLNLLINNAGRFCYEYERSEDGVEMTFATNYLGHFLLTNMLVEKMVVTARTDGVEGRVVNVTSQTHAWFDGDGIRYLRMVNEDGRFYNATRAYELSKLANVWHTTEIARKLKKMEANVTANCVHPGIVKTRLNRQREGLTTDLIFFLASKLLKTIPQAAGAVCYVATHPKVKGVSGKYFVDCNEAAWPSKLGSDENEAAKMWDFSEALIAEKLKLGLNSVYSL
ncbi:hypothetical protein Scep_025377 [Stephania cephalantha]|uniref:Short-chain dehydrogenase TIC 32, chloroplastic n=1 Tax=Stephania cephalantha TaxID=152367 RepID=A0AAP0EQG4_9MAGN